jgi:hypothetical protein
MRAANACLALDPFRAGDVSAVLHGAFLNAIAAEAGISIPQARRRMRQLQVDGRAMRSDTAGGCTRWWLAGLAPRSTASLPKTSPTAAREHRALTPAVSTNQHWSSVLGVARDCSTSEARAAFARARAALDDSSPDYPNQRQRIHDAIDACCREHEIQIQE